MKKLFILLFLFLAACGGNNAITPERGSWDGNSFANDFLQFTVPEDWQIYSHAAIAVQQPETTVEFFTRDPATESTISLTFQPTPSSRNFSLENFLNECGASETAHFSDHGLLAMHRLTGSTTIANLSWQTKRTEIYAPGTGIIALQFHLSTEKNGYIHCLHFLVDNDAEFFRTHSWFTTI